MESDADIKNLWDEALSGPDADIEIPYSKKTFFLKSEQEIFASFDRNIIARVSELDVLPPVLFNYYFSYLNRYIEAGKHAQDWIEDLASCYLSLLKSKLESQELLCSSIEETENAVNYLLINVDKYNDMPEIYGDMREIIAGIKSDLVSYETSFRK